jgi:hypothetical protein
MTDENENAHAVTKEEVQDALKRASRVSRLLKRSAETWLEIAKEVNDAKNTLSKNAFDLFLQKSALTQSIADKMPRIAQASILYLDESKQHLEKLEGWTTLYEVAKLSEDEVREMYKKLQENPEQCLTRSFIQQFRTQTSTGQSTFIMIATITLTEDDLKRLDYDEYLSFRDSIDAVQRIIDRSITAAKISIHAKGFEKAEEIILNQTTVDTDADKQDDFDLIDIEAITAANNDCSIFSTKTH